MILITSLVAIAIVHFFGNDGMPFAVFISLVVEVLTLIFLYNLIKKTEETIVKKYEKINGSLKKQIIAFENSQADLKREKDLLKKKLLESEGQRLSQATLISEYQKDIKNHLDTISEQKKVLEDRSFFSR